MIKIGVTLFCLLFCFLAVSSQFGGNFGTNNNKKKSKSKWNEEIADRCFCKLQGEVDDCSCRVESLDSLNNNKLYPRLNSLLARNYFRYFKVNLKKECPFWSDDSRCALKDCAVDVCDRDEVPIKLEEEDNASVHEKNKYSEESNTAFTEESCAEERELSALDTTISDAKKAEFNSWKKHDDSLPLFCDIDDERTNGLDYVDLLLNPERYTGYKGPSPRRIWRAIYEENCFKPETDKSIAYGPKATTDTVNIDAMCLEKRVFYRLISGLHTSINVHLCDQYLHPDPTGFGPGTWGHNLKEFQRRFDPEASKGQGPQRLKNLYFTYLVELRALAKVAPYLKKEIFYTGDPAEDAALKQGVEDLMEIIQSFPDHFDESQLFKENSKEMLQLKAEFVEHFRNISRIMDCVGCDKCKLWGKLQIMGMGTALKILFAAPDGPIQPSVPDFQLTRQEIVTLFNGFGRLASSIYALETFRKLAR